MKSSKFYQRWYLNPILDINYYLFDIINITQPFLQQNLNFSHIQIHLYVLPLKKKN